MARTNWILGSQLSAERQREALAMFVYRNTVENRKSAPKGSPLAGWLDCRKLVTDSQWLASTYFAITADGKRFNRKVTRCSSIALQENATFTNGPRGWSRRAEGESSK